MHLHIYTHVYVGFLPLLPTPVLTCVPHVHTLYFSPTNVGSLIPKPSHAKYEGLGMRLECWMCTTTHFLHV